MNRGVRGRSAINVIGMYRSKFVLFAFCLVSLLGSLLHAQVSRVSPRVRGPIDESDLTTLRGNVPLVARTEYDRGEAEPGTTLTHVRIVFQRSAEQEAALDQLEQSLLDKSSPLFHKWLTPQEFGERFGPADSDIAAVTAWLQSHGLVVEGVDSGRSNLSFSGTVAQVEETLHTPIHTFAAGRRRFLSNTTDPKIPAAFAQVVAGIAHLDTLRPAPLSVPGRKGHFDPATKRFELVANTLQAAPVPELSNQSGNLWIDPADAATIYDTPNAAFNPNYTSSTTYDGTGVTIGIISGALVQTSIVQNYRQLFLGDSAGPVTTNVGSLPSTFTSAEAYLDTELAGALAPGASIHVYADDNLDAGIQQALSDNTADILSVSYGECEQDRTTADNTQINNYWKQAAAQGIAVVVGSGDSGSAGCDPFNVNGQDTAEAIYGLNVNGLASTPYNIAVGGTDLVGLKTNSTAYLSPTNLGKYYRSALSYIPESTWNDSTQSNTTLSKNVPWSVGLNPYPAQITAGGGGPSNCSTNKTQYSPGACVSGYPKPSWQRGTGVPADGVRDLPDISLMAGTGHNLAAWIVCDESTGSGVGTDCSRQPDGSFGFAGFGGTSASTPIFAGILALVQQSSGGRLGQAAAQLYDLYNGTHAAQVFHDITVGNISVACKSGTPNCTTNTAGYKYETGFDSTVGYDLASGLGSVDVAQLVAYWSTATGSASANVTVTPAETSLPADQSLSVTVTVSGSGSALPTGSVTLSNGTYVSSPASLANGSASFSIPANTLTPGAATLTAIYSGDINYAPATGTATVTITSIVIPPAFTITATNPASVTAGASASSALTVSGTGGYAGTVTFTCALTSSPAGAINLPTCTSGPSVTLSPTAPTATSTISVNTTAPGSSASVAQATGRWLSTAATGLVLAAVVFVLPCRSNRWKEMLGVLAIIVALGLYSVGCGSSSASSTSSGGGSPPVKTGPTVSVKPGSTSIQVNAALPVSVTVTGSGSAVPSGTVQLTSGTYKSSSASLTNGQTSITIPANTLAVGTDTLSASYAGDGNYSAAQGSASVIVTNPPPPGTTAGTYTFTVTAAGNDPAKTSATATFALVVE